ncbi:MAG: MFS transporter [Chloroflexi bacterium]|nr:MFS transporter [Chloroflexota bacterium]
MALTSKDRRYYFIALPAGHGAVDWIGAGMFLLAPAIAFGGVELSPVRIGLLFGTRALFSSIFYIPAGIVGDSVRRQGLVMLATIWWVGLAGIGAAFAPNYWVLVVAFIVSSAGSSFWHPLAMGAMVQRMPGRRAMAVAVHGVGGSASEVLAPLLVGILLAVIGWRQVLFINALFPLVAAILLLRVAAVVGPETKHRASRSDFKALARIGRRPVALGLLLAMGLYNMSNIALMTMAPIYLKDVRGFSPQAAGATLAALLVAGTVGSPLVGALSDRLGRKSVTVVGMIAGGAALWAMTLMPETISLVAAMMVAGFCLISIRAVLTAAALDIVGQREATVIGFLFAIGEGIGALGSLIAGIIGNASLEWALIFAALLAFSVGGLVGALPLRASGQPARATA